MRRKLVAGNWKMNTTAAEAAALASAIREKVASFDKADVLVCPPFTALDAVGKALAGSNVRLGAQTMYWEPAGAHTGEISAPMLQALDCAYVILGHSERRARFGATNQTVNRKTKVALEAGLTPIVCVGETLEQREAGQTETVVSDMVQNSLAELTDAIRNTVIAYEPVWAIGTGKTATPDQAQEVHAMIRGLVEKIAGATIAQAVTILYGGSVKPDNAGILFGQPDIDGGLIGGAALKADSFVEIVEAAG